MAHVSPRPRPTTRRSGWFGRRDVGASLVEFALVLPLLILLIAGLLDFGLFFNAQLQLSNSAQEGARMAALGKPLGTRTSNGDDIWTRVKRASPTLDSTSLDVALNTPCSNPPTAGSVVDVTVSLPNYEWVLLGQAMSLFGGAGTLPKPTATAQLRCA